jgi:pectinacetylesterase
MKKVIGFVTIVFLACLLIQVGAPSYAKGPKSKPFLPDISPNWAEIVPEPTEFMGRNLTPTCIGYPGEDSTFSFFTKGGTVNNLVVFFDGGGACWDTMNCLYAPTCSLTVDESIAELEAAGGIFDTDNPNNPFKNWSFVAIPYCTGDIHWGSNDVEYVDYLNKLGGNVTLHHRGFDNFLVVLKWITENFKKPHKIFVTGSSAGRYGATLGFPYLQETYPKTKVSLLGDAGNGVVSEDFKNFFIFNWGIQPNLPTWISGFDLPFSAIDMAEIYNLIADYYPHRKVGQYTTAWDWNQTFFYNVMLNILDPEIWDTWQPVWCDWHDQMIDLVYAASETPNYRYYIGAGSDHTIMGYDKFYEEVSAGILFLDWIEVMVGNQGGTHGHGGVPWENVECTECLDPWPCP